MIFATKLRTSLSVKCHMKYWPSAWCHKHLKGFWEWISNIVDRSHQIRKKSFIDQNIWRRYWNPFFYTSMKSWRGYIFTVLCLCVCVSVCLCVRLCLWTKFQLTDTPIWTAIFANNCLPHWLKPYWNWWPWVKSQGHSDSI